MMSSSLAIEGRCSRALVDPPMALCTMIAFSNASRVMISLGLISLAARFIIARPACRASWRISRMVAGISAVPGSAMPSASAMDCMVLAVPRKAQAPSEGQPVSL